MNPAKAPAGPAHGKGPKPELRTMDQVIIPSCFNVVKSVWHQFINCHPFFCADSALSPRHCLEQHPQGSQLTGDKAL